MRLVAAMLSLLALPGLAAAQTMAAMQKPELVMANSSPRIFDQLFYSPATIGGTATTPSSVMPLWSTPDGRILAIVALGSNAGSPPTLSPAPQFVTATDLKLIDVTDYVSGGLGVSLRDNIGAYAKFDQGLTLTPSRSAVASLDCSAAFNFGLNNRCLTSNPRAGNGALRVGTALAAGSLNVDLSYGLSWLRSGDDQHLGGVPQQPFWDLFSGLNSNGVPTLVIPGIELADIQSSGVNATGRWNFDEHQSVDLGASVGRIQLELPGTATLLPSINEAALSVGIRRGDFSGVVIGHVVGPADLLNSGQHFSSVDLGISWRAPWRGVFSVGAQNMWSSGSAPALIDPAAREVDAGQSRVPYVQYHQDL